MLVLNILPSVRLLPVSTSFNALCQVRYLKKPRSVDRPLPSTAQDFRREQKLPVNRCSRGPLTDLADYSHLDGQPAQACVAQLRRSRDNREAMEAIVNLLDEVEFSEKFHAERVARAESAEFERQNNAFHAKGDSLLN